MEKLFLFQLYQEFCCHNIWAFYFQTSSTDVSPTSTPCGTPLSGAPKYGTVIPNRIFVGGIAANVSIVTVFVRARIEKTEKDCYSLICVRVLETVKPKVRPLFLGTNVIQQ